MAGKSSGTSEVSSTLGGRVNSTGKKIVAKLAVVVAVSGSVFTLSTTPAIAFSGARGESGHAYDRNAFMEVNGDCTGWTTNGSWYKNQFYGHIKITFPDGSYVNSPDSNNPRLSDVSGVGCGRVTVTGYKLISPGKYEEVGQPSLAVY